MAFESAHLFLKEKIQRRMLKCRGGSVENICLDVLTLQEIS